MLPHADVDPAALRATRALLRRRLPLTRTRAERLAHIQQTTSPDHLPALGQQRADQANRDGGVERCSAPAVQQRGAVDLALIGGEDQWLSDGEVTLVQTAKPHEAHPVSRLPSIPGLGQLVRVVLRDDIHAMRRFPRVQDVVS
jgi:hypothetical protein